MPRGSSDTGPSRTFKQYGAADFPLNCHETARGPTRAVRALSAGTLVCIPIEPLDGATGPEAIDLVAGEKLEISICGVVSWSGPGSLLLLW